jgi:hypothetical protein
MVRRAGKQAGNGVPAPASLCGSGSGVHGVGRATSATWSRLVQRAATRRGRSHGNFGLREALSSLPLPVSARSAVQSVTGYGRGTNAAQVPGKASAAPHPPDASSSASVIVPASFAAAAFGTGRPVAARATPPRRLSAGLRPWVWLGPLSG